MNKQTNKQRLLHIYKYKYTHVRIHVYTFMYLCRYFKYTPDEITHHPAKCSTADVPDASNSLVVVLSIEYEYIPWERTQKLLGRRMSTKTAAILLVEGPYQKP